MMNDLLACLETYKLCILTGNVPEEYTERAKKVLDEIKQLESLLAKREIVNYYDFNSLKRDIAFVFHPDHFKSIPGVIDNAPDTLGTFFGAIDKINDAIKKGYVFRGESRTGTSRRVNNVKEENKKKTQREYFTKKESTNSKDTKDDKGKAVITFISNRFNMLFRNIPSNSDDYSHILNRFKKRLHRLEVQLKSFELDIEMINKSIRHSNEERRKAISSQKVNEKYKELLDSLFDQANSCYGQMMDDKDSLDERLKELASVIDSRLEVREKRYQAMLRQYEQLTKDFNSALRRNLKEQQELINRKLNTLNHEIAIEAQIMNIGLRKVVSQDVTDSDVLYQDLLRKYNASKKQFEIADKRYRYVQSNEKLTKEEIRFSIEEEYSKAINEDTKKLQSAKRKREKLLSSIEKVEDEIMEFRCKYSKFAPKSKRK